MAWTPKDSVALSSKTANQASLEASTATILNPSWYEPACLGIVGIAVDNNATVDGDEGAVSGIVDSSGNRYSKAAEFCNAQGAAQGGATVSLWYCNYLRPLTVSPSGTITASFTNAASRDASAMCCALFSGGLGTRPVLVGTPQTLANDAADAGSMTLGSLPLGEHLWIRATAREGNSAVEGATTGPPAWTDLAGAASSGGSAITNQAINLEYLIATATTATSDPTTSAVDQAAVLVAFDELLVAPQRIRPKGVLLGPRVRRL